MATIYGKVSGSYQTIVDPQAKVSGSWLPVQQAYGKVSGVWQTVYLRGFAFNATISSDTQNYNLSTAAVGAGWNGSDPLLATVTINSGVVVGSSSTGTYAFTIPSLPTGSTVAITNNGYIVGCGGPGAVTSGESSGPGGDGGPALSVAFATTITNASGTIGGAGGGAGGTDGDADTGVFPHAGGGGAGNSIGTQTPGGTGTPATLTTGGVGNGVNQFGPSGGNLGQPGDPGDYGGGAPGACTSGNSNIVWISTGTRLGTLG